VGHCLSKAWGCTKTDPGVCAGFGSDKTAVFSVIKLTGEGLLPFNSSLGQSFVDALGNILGEPPAEDRRGGGGDAGCPWKHSV